MIFWKKWKRASQGTIHTIWHTSQVPTSDFSKTNYTCQFTDEISHEVLQKLLFSKIAIWSWNKHVKQYLLIFKRNLFKSFLFRSNLWGIFQICKMKLASLSERAAHRKLCVSNVALTMHWWWAIMVRHHSSNYLTKMRTEWFLKSKSKK